MGRGRKTGARFWAQGERREKRGRDRESWGPGPVQFGSHVGAPPTFWGRKGLSGECSPTAHSVSKYVDHQPAYDQPTHGTKNILILPKLP